MEYSSEKVWRLRKSYEKAIEEGRKSFTFCGETFVIDYAKYLLEYLEGEFSGKKKN